MSSSIRKLIGSRIRTFRKQKNVTQAALAEAIGCEVTTLGRYERGEYAPDGEQIVKIAVFFSITPMDLLPGKVDMDRQLILDLRSDLVDAIFAIDDPRELEKLCKMAREAAFRPPKSR